MLAKDADVLISYKSFSAVSHVGLGIAALNNSKVLRSVGLKVVVLSTPTVADLVKTLEQHPRTHVVISAPWIPTVSIQALCLKYPETQFYVVSHSNVGFLQADSNGVKLFREYIDLETGTHNFHVAGNSARFAQWVREAFGVPCAYLPNCYFLDGSFQTPHPSWSPGQLIKIGAFGATRPLKNLMSAAGAAIEIGRSFRSPVEFWLSAGRTEGGGQTILNAVQALVANIPGFTLKANGWQPWPQFRQLVESMNLLIQPSYTESFNVVTADGASRGVPSVVSAAIDWMPSYMQAEVDDVLDISRVGRQVLMDRNAPRDAYNALVRHDIDGAEAWGDGLDITDLHKFKVPVLLPVHQV